MNKREILQSGQELVTSEKGNSMTPKIKSGQKHKLVPCTLAEVEVGDIVYCRVRGNYYTHLVTAKHKDKGVLISNNHGHNNGWTKQVFGKVTEVYNKK